MTRPILEDEEPQPKVPGWAYTYIDLLWLFESRQGKVSVGRSTLREPLAGAGNDPVALVAALRRALGRAAADIAAEIRRQSGIASAK